APGEVLVRAARRHRGGGRRLGTGGRRPHQAQDDGNGNNRKAQAGHESGDYNVTECLPTPDLPHLPGGSMNWVVSTPTASGSLRPTAASIAISACAAKTAAAGSRWTRHRGRKTSPPTCR